eukprot:tig00000471_g1191.t1
MPRSRSRSPRRDSRKDDRDRDRSPRRRRSRSRSRSPRGGRRDRDGRDSRSGRKDDPRDNRDRKDDRSRREKTPPAGSATRALTEANPWVDDDEGGEFEIRAEVSNAAGEVSCSIEETNRIRALLGLKPLKLDNEEEEKKKREQRIKAAEEAKKEREQLIMSARIQEAKEKRMANAVFAGKTLAEELAGEEESAASWIEKSRKLEQERREKEKELAAQRARALAEQEEELERQRAAEAEAAAYLQRRRRKPGAEGVGGVAGAIAAESNYTSRDLAGLKVAHDADAIGEGETVVLTLKDSAILSSDGVNEEADELENVRMAELEKRQRAYKASKKTTTPYDDNEFNATFDPNDPASQAEGKKLLTKYDEVKAPAGFVLDQAGGADEATRARMESIRAKLAAAAPANKTVVALAPAAATMKEAADYYTNEELAAFRKPKKKVVKKIRKKGTTELVAELEKINEATGAEAGADRGSRGAKAEEAAAREERERVERERRFERALGKANAVSKALLETSGSGSPAPRGAGREKSDLADEEEDAFDAELHKSLARARRIASASPAAPSPPPAASPSPTPDGGVFKVPPPPTRGPEAAVFAQMAASRRREAEEAASAAPEGEANIVFSDTGEFVRKLEIKQEYFEDDVGGRKTALPGGASTARGAASVRVQIPKAARGAGSDTEMADVKEEASGGEESQDEDTSFLLENPVAKGMAAALELVKNRGFLNADLDFGRGPDKTMKDLNKAEERLRLEYKDDFGNDMTPKEAFRWISWKFHGKMPGKMKQEKRLKKMQDRAAVKKAEGSDAPSVTLEAFRKVQEATGQAHVVLTGSNALRPEQLAPANVSKRKQPGAGAAGSSSSAKKPK